MAECHLPGAGWHELGCAREVGGPQLTAALEAAPLARESLDHREAVGGKSPTRQQPLNAQDWGRGSVKGRISQPEKLLRVRTSFMQGNCNSVPF